jgi:CMP-N-acetylneuraminic acid synthetase
MEGMKVDKKAIVILARVGSKRIPKKNWKLFCGKPLVHWTLEIAVETGVDTYLFTDNKNKEEMKEIKDKFPTVNICEKPKRFAQDKHRTMDELRYYDKSIKADAYILLQPTSPLRDIKIVNEWIKYFDTHDNYISGISVYRLPKKYFYMDGQPINFNQEVRDSNGCEKKNLYFENGSFYYFKKEVLKHTHVIKKPCQLFLDKYGFDLDNEIQWAQAENFCVQEQKFKEMNERIQKVAKNEK